MIPNEMTWSDSKQHHWNVLFNIACGRVDNGHHSFLHIVAYSTQWKSLKMRTLEYANIVTACYLVWRKTKLPNKSETYLLPSQALAFITSITTKRKRLCSKSQRRHTSIEEICSTKKDVQPRHRKMTKRSHVNDYVHDTYVPKESRPMSSSTSTYQVPDKLQHTTKNSSNSLQRYTKTQIATL